MLRLGAPQTYSVSGHYHGRPLPCAALLRVGAPWSQSVWTPPCVITLTPLSGTSTQEPTTASETSPPETRPGSQPCPHRSPRGSGS